jgi:hypothetical protein
MFNKPNTAKNRADDSWKAQAFLNLSLPFDNEAGKQKIGSIPLKADRKGIDDLIAFLNADPKNVESLRDMLILDFQLAETEEGTGGFILPGTAKSDTSAENTSVVDQ